MFVPIPNLTALRLEKPGYEVRYPIDTEHPLHNDPLVDPREYQFFGDASSHYSKPDKRTGKILPGIPDAPLVRNDVFERLKRAEQFLRTDRDVREALGAAAHLKIDDGIRPYEAQVYAFYVAWPDVISRMNPGYSREEVLAQVPNYCAKPSSVPTPTPHLTGGAVDVALINLETGEAFNRGHTSGKVKGTAYPDFHEGYHLQTGRSDIENSVGQAEVAPDASQVTMGRRVLYHAMTAAGLYVNPQEIWHYGLGDPLSAFVSGSNRPYYGVAELPEWYTQQMKTSNP